LSDCREQRPILIQFICWLNQSGQRDSKPNQQLRAMSKSTKFWSMSFRESRDETGNGRNLSEKFSL